MRLLVPCLGALLALAVSAPSRTGGLRGAMRLLVPGLGALLPLAVSAPPHAQSPAAGGADASMAGITFPGDPAAEPQLRFPAPVATPAPAATPVEAPAPIGAALTTTAVPAIPLVTTATAFGSTARVRTDGRAAIPLVTTAPAFGSTARVRTDGRAAIPRGAPRSVRAIIAAANQIIGKPYKWGGGHARLVDRGYDCSGSVSYALIGAGVLPSPLVSGSFARWGANGTGRWTAIYANRGHVYLEVAGLRLDPSPVGDPGGRSGVRWRPAIGRRPGFRVRHVAGL